ncbi:hypothetical protein GLOIN_2v1771092 [Rhizophagus irregularis DAOM 181602=DAOM 197198]|nr:hypothetical protein GLOIN_2v1771092 [Rhizophagus irregularis DAOM 181602=DAOM 197198]
MYDKDIYGLKHIYDLQVGDAMLYQATGNETLKNLFEIQMIQLQLDNWINGCMGDNGSYLGNNKNSYIGGALKNFKGELEVRKLLGEREFRRARNSLKKKEIIFFDQLIEYNGGKLMKWKYLCSEKDKGLKGKIPKWFKLIDRG